jgi:anti-anti-sigma factor
MTFECSVERESDHGVIVTVRGDIDLATAHDLEACVRGALDGASSVVVDMAGVTFLDSSGLRSLVLLQEEAQSHGTSITLRSTQRNVRRVFDLTGLAATFSFSDA